MDNSERRLKMSATQAAAVLFLAVTILGLLGAVSYTIVRAKSETAARETQAIAPLIVEPIEAAAPSAPESMPPPAPKAELAVTESGGSLFVTPVAGETYLQTSATSQAESEKLVLALRSNGFPARYSAGPSKTVFRVLIGPIQNEEQYNEWRARLDEAGVEHFERRYPDLATSAGEPAP